MQPKHTTVCFSPPKRNLNRKKEKITRCHKIVSVCQNISDCIAQLIQPSNSVKFLFSPPGMFVFTLKSNKLSQWYEVSVLAHSEGKVHTQLLIGSSCDINSKESQTYLSAHAFSCSYFRFGSCLHLSFSLISLFCHTGEYSVNKVDYYYKNNLIVCRSGNFHLMTSWFCCKQHVRKECTYTP